jgi:bacillithiol biosynthesis deacetylase BshB1
MLDLLVIAPHPDDAELGMAGSILRFKAEGLCVGVLDLTDGEPTPFGSPEIRANETAAATKLLDLDWRENLGLPNRRKLAEVFRRVRPKWLFAPYWVDAHPDHMAATPMIEAARFWSKLTKTDMPGEPFHPPRIIYYSCVHLRVVDPPTFVIDISEHWDRKQQALECYTSQFITGRPQNPPTFIDRLRDQAAYWGWSIGTRYAEPFWSREPIGVRSLRDFI